MKAQFGDSELAAELPSPEPDDDGRVGRQLVEARMGEQGWSLPRPYLAAGAADLARGFGSISLWGRLSWDDVRQRYRRSVLGPFWLTLSTGIMVAALGILYAGIFSMPLEKYMPYLALGLLFWGFVSQVLCDGSVVFIQSEGLIRQVRLPLFLHVMRMMSRNVIILAHNMLVFVVIVVLLGPIPDLESLMVIPGFILLILVLSSMSLVFGIVGARYRDVPPFVASVLQLGMFLTPIMWEPAMLRTHPAFVAFNPMFYLIEIVRAPLLDQAVPIEHWLIAGSLAIAGWSLAFLLFSRFRARIAYWV